MTTARVRYRKPESLLLCPTRCFRCPRGPSGRGRLFAHWARPPARTAPSRRNSGAMTTSRSLKTACCARHDRCKASKPMPAWSRPTPLRLVGMALLMALALLAPGPGPCPCGPGSPSGVGHECCGPEAGSHSLRPAPCGANCCAPAIVASTAVAASHSPTAMLTEHANPLPSESSVSQDSTAPESPAPLVVLSRPILRL